MSTKRPNRSNNDKTKSPIPIARNKPSAINIVSIKINHSKYKHVLIATHELLDSSSESTK